MTRAVVFAYSEVGVRCVRELLAQGVEIPLLFTHADDPGEKQWFGSVRQVAEAHDLRVETPINPNTPEWLAAGVAAHPDFLFSFYYRYMLDKAWLGIPRRGALNMHGSLLPKYRGRAPVHWAILNGETMTGASLHYMVEKPDAGALVDQQSVLILENDTALDVSLKVAEAAAQVLRRSLPALVAGTAEPRPLDLSKGSYFGRRHPEDGRIDWRRAARAVHDLVRAVAPPFPGAFTDLGSQRLVFAGSNWCGEACAYPQLAPCLYVEDGRLYLDCSDGLRLKIAALSVDAAPLDAQAFRHRYAAAPLPLSTTASKRKLQI